MEEQAVIQALAETAAQLEGVAYELSEQQEYGLRELFYYKLAEQELVASDAEVHHPFAFRAERIALADTTLNNLSKKIEESTNENVKPLAELLVSYQNISNMFRDVEKRNIDQLNFALLRASTAQPSETDEEYNEILSQAQLVGAYLLIGYAPMSRFKMVFEGEDVIVDYYYSDDFTHDTTKLAEFLNKDKEEQLAYVREHVDIEMVLLKKCNKQTPVVDK